MSTLATITSPAFLPIGTNRGPDLIQKKSAVFQHIAQSERLADVRPASHLEVRPRPEMISTGIPELDALTGGIARGCLTEICGPHSSGKTSMLLATMAAATQRGEACVLIDASDSFDPNSGATAGMNFNKLLWVRCGKRNQSLAFGPRSSGKPSSFVERRSLSTNSKSPSNENSVRCGTRGSFADDRRPTAEDITRSRNHPERRLEQVLKSTDLILQSGGFGLVALDLAGIPEKFVRRIPLASWFRFQRAVEHTKTALLVVSEIPCAQICAALVMQLSVASSQISGKPSALSRQPYGKPAHAEVLKELNVAVEIVRSRLERKPMQSVKASFVTHAVRAG